MSLSPSLSVLRHSQLERTRRLPIGGEILVREGDEVSATTIIARAQLPGEIFVARIAEHVGLEAHEVVPRLKKRIGDQVLQGELLLAESFLFGFLKTEYRCPVAGIVEMIIPETGHMVIRQAPKELLLSAYLAGSVIATDGNREVTIRSHAAFVQGVIGVGGERSGVLEVLPADPGENLRLAHLPNECHNKILVGGTAPPIEVLDHLASTGAAALVVGSISDEVLTKFLGFPLQTAMTGNEAVPFTLILTEGFGVIPMKTSIVSTLLPLSSSEAVVCGKTQVRAGAVRPEIIVPYKREGAFALESPPSRPTLEVSQTIRIVRAPYLGRPGQVIELPDAPQTLRNGVSCRVAIVALDDGEVVTVPRANLEI